MGFTASFPGGRTEQFSTTYQESQSKDIFQLGSLGAGTVWECVGGVGAKDWMVGGGGLGGRLSTI